MNDIGPNKIYNTLIDFLDIDCASAYFFSLNRLGQKIALWQHAIIQPIYFIFEEIVVKMR